MSLASSTSIGLNDLLAALALPPAALVQQRIPKKMLAENGAATLADRKLVQERIDVLTWHAALKPSTVGVAAFEDEQRSYLEVAVVSAKLRQDASPEANISPSLSTSLRRVAELVHRAIPYPTLLLVEDGPQLAISTAHIRWAQREAERTVVDGELVMVPIQFGLPAATDGQALAAFLAALALMNQPRTQLMDLYRGWMDTISAWQAVELTGHFKPSESAAQAAERRMALRVCKDLDVRIAAARSAASKEKQMARQVAANLEIKDLLTQRQQAAQNL
jgi:Domain of unknown function (DUF4391)